MDTKHDVLVIPQDFDPTTLSEGAQIALAFLEGQNKVIRVSSLTKFAVITVR